jgi:peroxiredoxin
MKRLICSAVTLFLIWANNGLGSQPLINARAPEFSLQDQYDKTVVLRQFEDRIVVLIASDKEGSVQNPQWKKAISEKYGDNIVILGIADVRSVPFFLKGKIRNDFKKDEGNILLDWKGEVFTAYGLAKGVSNIVVIDRHGFVRYRHAGGAAPDAVRRLFQEIDKLE